MKTADFYDLMKSETKYAKAKWAEKLGVSPSGFYTWLHDRKRRQTFNDALRKKIVFVFEEGHGVYGTDRICGILRRNGDSVSYPVVKRIMAQAAVFDGQQKSARSRV